MENGKKKSAHFFFVWRERRKKKRGFFSAAIAVAEIFVNYFAVEYIKASKYVCIKNDNDSKKMGRGGWGINRRGERNVDGTGVGGEDGRGERR